MPGMVDLVVRDSVEKRAVFFLLLFVVEFDCCVHCPTEAAAFETSRLQCHRLFLSNR